MSKLIELLRYFFKSGKLTLDPISDYTVIDVETTGLDPKKDELIEVAAIKVRNDEIVETYSSLIKPRTTIPPKITAITGITNEMVKKAPKRRAVIKELYDFIGDDIIMGHNVTFDIAFINNKNLTKHLNNDYFDTLEYTRAKLPKLYSYKLTSLKKYFNIKIDKKEHRALADAIVTYKVHQRAKDR